MRWMVLAVVLLSVPLAAAATLSNPYCTVWGSVVHVAGDEATRVRVINVSVAERSADEYSADKCMVQSEKVQPFQLTERPDRLSAGDTVRGIAHFENGLKLQNITITTNAVETSDSGPIAAITGFFGGLLNAVGL